MQPNTGAALPVDRLPSYTNGERSSVCRAGHLLFSSPFLVHLSSSLPSSSVCLWASSLSSSLPSFSVCLWASPLLFSLHRPPLLFSSIVQCLPLASPLLLSSACLAGYLSLSSLSSLSLSLSLSLSPRTVTLLLCRDGLDSVPGPACGERDRLHRSPAKPRGRLRGGVALFGGGRFSLFFFVIKNS